MMLLVMIHYCAHCEYNSTYKWVVRRHMEKKHPNVQSGEGINLPNLNHHSSEEGESDSESDSMETDVADLDTDSVSDSNEDNVVDLIDEIHNSFLTLLDLRNRYREVLPQINDLGREELKEVFERYAALEAKIVDEHDGLDPKENEVVDDDVVAPVNEEVVEEMVNCTECTKEGLMDFVFELENFLTVDEKKILVIYERKAWKKLSREKNIEDDSDSDVETDRDTIVQKEIRNVKDVVEDFKEKGSECFKDCSKSKIKSICSMCEAMMNPEGEEVFKKLNPETFEDIKVELNPIAESVRKLADPQVTVHEKRKTLQKTQVGEGILTALSKLILPPLTEYILNKVR